MSFQINVGDCPIEKILDKTCIGTRYVFTVNKFDLTLSRVRHNWGNPKTGTNANYSCTNNKKL